MKASLRKKKKPVSVAKLVEKAAVLLQKLVRLKASDDNGYCTCVTCGVVKHWKEMQGGHFISRVYTSTKLVEENVHPQCFLCNGPLRGNMIQYTIFMVDTYGRSFVDSLIELKRQPKKYTRVEAEERIEELSEAVLEAESGF